MSPYSIHCVGKMECAKCSQTVVINDVVYCCNCKQRFHSRCVGIGNAAIKLINANDNLLFKCDNCLSVQCCDEQNVSVLDVKVIRDKMTKISASFTDLQNNIAAQIDNAFKIGMEEMRLNVNGTLKERVADFEKLMHEKMNNMTLSFFENKRDRDLVAMNSVISEPADLSRNSAKKVKKRKLNEDEKQSFSDEPMTYANVLSGSKKRKACPVIVNKPKESTQSSEATREFLKSK